MSLGHELRWATRTVTRNSAFSFLVIVTLALGIALNAVVAAFVDSLLFRAAPGTRARNAVAIFGKDGDGTPGVLSYRNLVDYRAESRTLAHIAAWKLRGGVNVRSGEDVVRTAAMFVTAGYFEAAGVAPAHGRFITSDEDRVPNEAAVVVLTDAFWRSRFGARDVIGRDLVINDRAFRIIGIAPPSFRGTMSMEQTDLFVPMMMLPHFMPSDGNLLENRGWSGVYGVAQIRPGTTMEAAEAELATIAARLEKEYPSANAGAGVALMPLARAALPPQARAVATRSAAILAIVSFGALALICANIANLFVGRAVVRSREIAVRSILGAGRWGVARQLAIESLLLSACGGVAGLALAAGAIRVLRANVHQAEVVALTLPAVLVAAGLALIAGLACGLVPVIAASSTVVQRALRGTGATGRGTHRVSSALVALQVAVSVVLLTVSALFIITLRNLGEIALGFETRGALAAELAITARDDQNRETYDAVLQRVRALPWVESATLGNLLPLSGGFDQMQMLREGDPVEKAIQVSYFIVAPDYFRTLRIPLRRGRDLSDADGPAAPLAGVINEKLARRYWPNEDPLGKQIRLRGGPLFEVIGVVGDSRLSEVRAETTPAVYFHHAQAAAFGTFNLGVLVRTSRDASSATRDLRAAIASTGVPVGEVVALDQVRRNSAAAERMMSLLIGVVAVLSLAISALGLYGVLALSIAQRTREIGIRMALGAIPSNLIRSTMARGATLALAGFVAGSAIVAAGGRLLTPFLFGTRVADPMPWAMVIAFVALSVIAATLVPARRAARVQPAVALRHE